MDNDTDENTSTQRRAGDGTEHERLDSAWVRLFNLHQKRLAERARGSEEAAEARRRQEDEVDKERRRRHRSATVTDTEAESFFQAQLRWRQLSDAHSRQQWLNERRAEYSAHRDPVLSPHSREIAEAKGLGGPVKEWDRRMARFLLTRGWGLNGALALTGSSAALPSDGSSQLSPRARTLSSSALRASVQRQHYDELKRRADHLKTLIEDLEWEATAGGREAGTPIFHPCTTPHRSTSQRRRQTGEELGRTLHKCAEDQRERRKAAQRASLEAQEAAHPFTPQLCARSEEMELPHRRPLYPPPKPADARPDEAAQQTGSSDQRRQLTRAEVASFHARNDRLTQQRDIDVREQLRASAARQLSECTFRPRLTQRTRQLAAAKEWKLEADADGTPEVSACGSGRLLVYDTSSIHSTSCHFPPSASFGATGASPPPPACSHEASRQGAADNRRGPPTHCPSHSSSGTPVLRAGRLGRLADVELPYRSFSHQTQSAPSSPGARGKGPSSRGASRGPMRKETLYWERDDEADANARRVQREVAAFQTEMASLLQELSRSP